MAETWPAGLPNPSSSNYSITPGDGRVITKMEQGPRRIRKRFVNVPNAFRVSLQLTKAEFETFKTFWTTTLDDGLKTVNMPLLYGSTISNIEVQVISRDYQLAGVDEFVVDMEVETV